MANGVADRTALLQHLISLITSCAGDAGVPETILVRESVVVVARLTHRVVVRLAAVQHAMAFGTFGAGFTPVRDFAMVVAIVACANGVVGVGAGRAHAEQACAFCTKLTFLCVAEAF